MSGLLWIRRAVFNRGANQLSGCHRRQQRGTCAGSRWEPRPRWGRVGGAERRSLLTPAVPAATTRGSTVPARPAPPSPQSPPPTPCLPPAPAPLSPARPRAARAPLDSGGSRSPGVRPAAPSPGGHGGAPGLPALGLGASPPPAAPRRLPAPPGAQRFRAPRAGIPAGLVAGGGLGGPGLGPEPHFHRCLPHPLLLLPAPRASRVQDPLARRRLRHLELHCRPSRRLPASARSRKDSSIRWMEKVRFWRGSESRAAICIGIGIGFYGNSETSDGVSQLSSALLHANHTLSAIDHLVLETVERLGEAVRTELTTLEEVLEPRTELVAAARGARRQAEAVAQQLQGLAFWQGVPLSPLQVAEDVSFVEEYRWLAYVLLLLLELLVCLFTLLGLAKQSKWLVIVMTVMSLLVLVLSWGSMGLEAATAVGLSDFCSNPDPYVLNLTQEETGLSSEADSVPASSGQHPLPAAGPGERSCASVPFSAEASAVLGGDSECDRRKLSPVGGTAALPWPAQGLRRSPAGPVRRRPGRPALPAALLPAVRGSTGHRALQPAPRLGPLPTQESKRFVQWQSSI
ncbi:protein tweety homolog 1 isoform X9 [Macaca fascicularis]|uniref:protein tweety homolog 1 isoform X9 n=1 Tax=Macaca fascicularis TaxID=9541 RepID=UPI0032B02F2B